MATTISVSRKSPPFQLKGPYWSPARQASSLQGRAAGRTGHTRIASHVVLDDARLRRAEHALTRGADRRSGTRADVGIVQAVAALGRGIFERLAALGASRQSVVDDSFAAGAERTGVQFQQGGREADRRARRRVVHFTRVDRANRTDSRRFVGRHLRLDEVRDRGGDD